MKTFYKSYKLKIDLPAGEKKGDVFFFMGKSSQTGELWYKVGERQNRTCRWVKSYTSKGNDTILYMNQMKKEFFEPIGDEKPLYPKFPNKNDFKDYYDLLGDARLVESVDEIRAINTIFESQEFYDNVYSLLKTTYEDKYFKGEK